MKKETLRNNLAKRFTGNKNIGEYRLVKDWIERSHVQKVIRPCYTSGRGRFTRNADYTPGVGKILTLIGVKFEAGNDAPKGSPTGNYYNILTKIK
jgi:hypothetical protein